jgi:5-methylcytosine-specific restriction protein B
MSSNFSWIGFQTELADKLLKFEDDRQSIISCLVNVYKSKGLRLPTLDSTPEPQDIDPFSVFALFNKQLAVDTKKRICSGLAESFGMTSAIPDDFDGIPVLNNLRATFYRFSNDPQRAPDHIDNLWKTFKAALSLVDSPSIQSREIFASAYDTVVKQPLISWNITIGLYWIRPAFFLSLDSRNRWYLSDSDHLDPEISETISALRAIPNSQTYLEICDRVRNVLESGNLPYRTLPELSYASWLESERVNKLIAESKDSSEEDESRDSPETQGTHYWLYAPGEGASKWNEFYSNGIMAIGWSDVGNLLQYGTREDIRLKFCDLYGKEGTYSNDTLALWQFVHELKPGDVIFAKQGRAMIIGRGVVEGEYEYQESAGDFPNIRRVRWTHKGNWDNKLSFAMKTLTDVTPYKDFVTKVEGYFEPKQKVVEAQPREELEVYTDADFLKEVFMEEGKYRSVAGILKDKRNAILQGPPGVGKTFAAKRLAYSIMGVRDQSRVQMIQFHQSYSYEDFIEGYRPAGTGFNLYKGIFYKFCKQAECDPDHEYFFVIDEINRGNLSRIFGELFMLIEADKRGIKLPLLYSQELFCVPENVYIIGTMNTADRSLAFLDYALRRRFAFIDLAPGFSTSGFKEFQETIASPRFDALVACLVHLNQTIAGDPSLGEGYCIGHSFLCNLKSADECSHERLSRIVDFEIIPLLKEYWFDSPEKVQVWTDQIHQSIK